MRILYRLAQVLSPFCLSLTPSSVQQVWIEFGRIHLPQGYHPNDVEKEWGKLIVAMLEREKSLRPEVERYEAHRYYGYSTVPPSLVPDISSKSDLRLTAAVLATTTPQHRVFAYT